MTMKHEGEKIRGEEGKRAGAAALLTFSRSQLLFFVLCFFYLWLVVEPHLIYCGFGTLLPDAPLFSTGGSFLRDSLSLPGGLVLYVSGFLSQGYYYAWLGAVIIVLAGSCLGELTRRHLATAGWGRAWLLAPVPAIMLFLIYSQYHHPLSTCLAVSLGLLLSVVFERLAPQQPWARAVACCLVAVVGFWLGGAGTWLVFALMTAIHALRSGKGWGVICTLLALSASAGITWALARYVFLIPVLEAWLILTPFAPSAMAGMDPFLKVLVFFLYGFAPGAVLLVCTGKSLFGGREPRPNLASRKTGKKGKHTPIPRRRWPWAIFAQPALSAFPIVLMALGLYVSHKDLRKPYVLSNYHACQKQWDKILEFARRLPKGKSNVFVNHDILRALYHTGRLPYDMFCYPLDPASILLTHEKDVSDLTQWKLSDIYVELGHVNAAQKLASELLTTRGNLGPVLEELGWINIIKGQPLTARVYLQALKKDLIYCRQAESLLNGLDNGFTPEQTASIDRIRSCRRDEATAMTGAEPVDQTLAALVEHNPRNKMAFEYLMACYLATNRVDKIAENVKKLRDLDYESIPTLYEEAILIASEAAGRPADLAGFRISRETQQRYHAFVQSLSAMQTANRTAVFNDLIRRFGTSYFFYFSFGRVGLM